ncbi:hypothetical protein DPMN_080127 [Dreissena polymorpha]|uniref:Uncharacterized protein n=1 Tax=Dreissena polymorpha TaxID=45954 RepID=A0A9D4BRI3_DREPO|nr:hypothetical protein DPMN_080127 [Dreissena polymorpha]
MRRGDTRRPLPRHFELLLSLCYRVLLTNVDGALDISRIYSFCDRSGVQMPLNTGFLTTTSCNGACVTKLVSDWMGKTPSGKWATWMVSLKA